MSSPLTPADLHTSGSSPSSAARRARRLLAVLAATSLLVAACGDDDGDDTTTTTAEADGGDDETTTTTPDDDESDEDDDATEITEDDLEALLPDASDIGAGWVVAEDDDDDDDDNGLDVDAEMERACPALAELSSDDDDDDDVEREFKDARGRTVGVSFDPSPQQLDEADFAERIDAINSCGTIEIETEQFTMTMELAAKADDSVGDQGVVVSMDAIAASPDLPRPIELSMTAHMFRVGSVAGSVEVMSGLDQQTLEPVAPELQLLDTLPQELGQALADLGA